MIELASSWKRFPLSSVVSFVGGGTPSKNNSSFYLGEIPWVTPKDMKLWRISTSIDKINDNAIANSSTKLIPPNAVLIVVRSGVLKHTFPVAVTEVAVCVNQDLKALICSEALDPNFLAYFLKASEPTILSWVRATTADNIPLDRLKDLPIPLPPLDQQRRIAAIFDKAQTLHVLRSSTLNLANKLPSSDFLKRFGDPERNPFGWAVCRLGELLTDGPQNGLYKPAKDYGSGTPILRIDSFYDGRVENLSALKRVKLAPSELSRYELKEADIVINRVNSIEYLGKSCIIEGLTEPTVFESNMMRMSLDQSRINPRFLIQYLQSQFIKQLIAQRAKHAINQASINQQDVVSLPIFLPPLPMQAEFAAATRTADKLLDSYVRSSEEMGQLVNALNHNYFSLVRDAAVSEQTQCLTSVS